jgi:2-polyprenyl-3-methyl-5-hydroxy-6-metoxy-1,4-benzoquinol methylase
VNALRDHGIEAIGIDPDDRVKDKHYLLQESVFSLEQDAELVLCLEVAEHIAEEMAIHVANNVALAVRPGGILIWSAAQPEQGGTGHINCQPKSYWLNLLTNCGLKHDETMEAQLLSYIKEGYHMGWFANNMMIFRR